VKCSCANTVQDGNVRVTEVVQLILDKMFKIFKAGTTTLSFTKIAALQDTDMTFF
jgi:hypothetical protein